MLAKLFWYFASGKSRVGYLRNYKENPIHLAQVVTQCMPFTDIQWEQKDEAEDVEGVCNNGEDDDRD